ADTLPGLVEGDYILAERVVRREIGPAAEPGALALGQVAEIGVHRWHEWAARVQHQRNAGRCEARPFAWNLFGEFRRHVAEDFREVGARLFEDGALDHDARASPSAALALPGVFAELARSVGLFQRGGDAIL